MVPTKFWEAQFPMEEDIQLSAGDPTMQYMMSIISSYVKNMVRIFSKTHALTDAQVSYKPGGGFGVKIGTMEIKLYKERMKSLKKYKPSCD